MTWLRAWLTGWRTPGGTAHRSLLLLPSTVVPGVAAFVGMVVIGHVGSLKIVGLIGLTRVGATFGSAMLSDAPVLAAQRSLAAGGPDRTRALRAAMLRRSGIFAPAGVAVGLVVSVWSTTIGVPLAVGSVLMVAEALFLFEFGVLRSLDRFTRASVLACSRSVAAWAAACAAVATAGTFGAAIAAYLVAIVVVGLAVEPPRLARVDDQTRADLRATWRSLSSYNLAGYALNNGDQYLLAIIAGPSAVGVYALGYTLGGGLIALMAEPIAWVLVPRIFREWAEPGGGPGRAAATARRGGTAVLAMGLVLTVALYVAGKLGLLTIVSSASALPAVAAIVALALSLHTATNLAFQSVLYLRGQSRLLSLTAWVSVVLAVVAIVGLTLAYEETGTALATLIAYSIMALLQYWVVRRGSSTPQVPAG